MSKKLKKQINLYLSHYFLTGTVVISILILAFGYFFIILPAQEKTSSNTTQNKIEQDRISANLTKQLTELNDINGAYQKINKNDISRLKEILPSDPEKEDLMKQMEILVSQYGLMLKSMQVEDGKADSGGLGKVNITLDVSGTDYSGLKNLLSALENNLRLLDIQSVEFNPSDRSTNLTLVAYYQK